MYQDRTYRHGMGSARFCSVELCVGESDLWIGFVGDVVDPVLLRNDAAGLLRKLRGELLSYPDSRFLSSLAPLPSRSDDSPFVRSMIDAAFLAGTGPMASVAGAIAGRVGAALKKQYGLREIVVENGGDLYLDILDPLPVSLVAPGNRLSGKLALVVDAAHCPLGISTSSGTYGPSLSLGKADAVMAVCRDPALSDAYATAFCNAVQRPQDVGPVCTAMNDKPDMVAAVVLMGDTMAVCGQLEVQT